MTQSAAAAAPSTVDRKLFDLINHARLHPEQYPPQGNTAGAVMTACATPLAWSDALWRTAKSHDAFLATQTLSWVNTFPNMHRGADGKLAWDDGGPIQKAGFTSFRAEIVAVGQARTAEAVAFWMQHDEASNWGHRNLILNPNAVNAGADYFSGGPGGHYYTMDVGNR